MECVKVETLDGGIAKVYLNRPQVMNAINARLRDELEEVLKELAEDDGIRVIILTGAETQGKRKAFSSGDDLREWNLTSIVPMSCRSTAKALIMS